MTAIALRSLMPSVLGSILVLALGACSGGGGGGGGGTGPDTPLPKLNSCDDVITQEKIDAFVASGEIPALGGLVGYGSASCDERKEQNGQIATRKVTGFAALSAIPAIQLTGRAEIKDNSVFGRKAEIEIKRSEMKNEDLEKVIKAFRSGSGRAQSSPTISIREPSFNAVLLGDLPKTDVFVRRVPDGDKEKLVIALDVPNGLSGAFQSALNSYVSGQPIVLYAETEPATATILRGTARAGSAVRVGTFKRVGIASYLSETWSKISSLAYDDKNIPYAWMGEAHSWWPSLKITTADGQREWKGAWSLASSLWNPRSFRTDQIGAENAMKALSFLMLLDPASAAKPYADKAERLRYFLAGERLYKETLLLVETRPYNVEQEETIFALAHRLLRGSRSEAWEKAKSLAVRARFSQTTIDLVFDVISWVETFDRYSAVEKGEEIVLAKGADRARFELLKEFASYLSSNGHQRTAPQKAIEYVIDKKISSEQVAAFKKAHAFLKTTRSSHNALDKAEQYLATLTADQVDRIISLHEFLKNTRESYYALDKAEKYVIELKLSKDVTDALVKAHEWLKTTRESYHALTKAEDYLLTRKLTPGKIDQLKKLELFIRTTRESYYSLQKAEDLVIEKKLSDEQTDLIAEAHEWLKTTRESYYAWDKSVKYVVEKKMTRVVFQRLKTAHDNYKKKGDYDALAKAEREAGL